MRTVNGAAHQVGRGFTFKRLFHRAVNPGLGYIAKEAEKSGITTVDQAEERVIKPKYRKRRLKKAAVKSVRKTKRKRAKKAGGKKVVVKRRKGIKRKRKNKAAADIFTK